MASELTFIHWPICWRRDLKIRVVPFEIIVIVSLEFEAAIDRIWNNMHSLACYPPIMLTGVSARH